jgi:hypothetical protein
MSGSVSNVSYNRKDFVNQYRMWMRSAHSLNTDAFAFILRTGKRETTEAPDQGSRAPVVPERGRLPERHRVVGSMREIHLALQTISYGSCSESITKHPPYHWVLAAT